jgi:hypothetical protein
MSALNVIKSLYNLLIEYTAYSNKCFLLSESVISAGNSLTPDNNILIVPLLSGIFVLLAAGVTTAVNAHISKRQVIGSVISTARIKWNEELRSSYIDFITTLHKIPFNEATFRSKIDEEIIHLQQFETKISLLLNRHDKAIMGQIHNHYNSSGKKQSKKSHKRSDDLHRDFWREMMDYRNLFLSTYKLSNEQNEMELAQKLGNLDLLLHIIMKTEWEKSKHFNL